MMKAVGLKFNINPYELAPPPGDMSPCRPSGNNSANSLVNGKDDFWKRPEIQDFIQGVNQSIETKLAGHRPSPRKVRMSVLSPMPSLNRSSNSNESIITTHFPKMPDLSDENVDYTNNIKPRISIVHQELIESFKLNENGNSRGDPEETERLVSRMIEVTIRLFYDFS